VWIDHNTFEDRDTTDDTLPKYFGVEYQIHDGLLDITNAADLVTASWNRFANHDKTMLIGSSDSAIADRGHLRVTLHHNSFENLGQRAPRVRFGQVHVYNNYYKIGNPSDYGYSWGVGIESAIYAQSNYFDADPSIPPRRFISRLNGTAIYAARTLVNGLAPQSLVDVVAAYNAANDPDLSTDVGWVPTLHGDVQAPQMLPSVVPLRAGPITW
jgi:pectate lyase